MLKIKLKWHWKRTETLLTKISPEKDCGPNIESWAKHSVEQQNF